MSHAAADRRDEFAWKPRQIFELLKQSGKDWSNDKAPKQAAAIAYYALLALGPLLIMIVSIAGLIYGPETIRQMLVNQLTSVSGGVNAGDVEMLINATVGDRMDGRSALAGLAAVLIAAAAVFGTLKSVLNQVWEIERAPAEGWKEKVKDFLVNKATTFAAVLATGLLVVASLAASTFLAAFSDTIPGPGWAWQILGFLVSAAVLTGAFAILFRYLPDAEVTWRDVSIGATVTAILFLIGQFAISYYIGRGAIGAQYGAAGALVAILVWLYYSSLILIFGAEFTQVYANRYGQRVEPDEHGRSYLDAVQDEHDHPSQEGTGRDERRPRRGGRGAT